MEEAEGAIKRGRMRSGERRKDSVGAMELEM